MDYRDIADDRDGFAEPIANEVEPFLLKSAARAIRFDPLEEQVMALARGDSLSSLEKPGGLDRLLSLMFGLRSASRALADPRLEALRRAVVVTRHRHHLPDRQAAELREQGYTLEQIHAVETRAISG